MADGGLVPMEVEDGLEESSRRAVEREVGRYMWWCRERESELWPLTAQLLEGYGRWVVMWGGMGAGIDNVISRVRREQGEGA